VFRAQSRFDVEDESWNVYQDTIKGKLVPLF
jgi:hypothetical protein